jgi:pyrroline-5-carboxylate reductase
MHVGLIGAGNMARALARGWGEAVLVSDGGSGRANALAAELGGEALDSNVAVAGTVVKVPETLMSAAGAVMGVGPAYQAPLVEAQVDAAVRHGDAVVEWGR